MLKMCSVDIPRCNCDDILHSNGTKGEEISVLRCSLPCSSEELVCVCQFYETDGEIKMNVVGR